MKLITTTGFFNTGSSGITHILSEIEGMNVPDEVYEVRLLYDPDCISDLEYNLVENPHRQNTSNAIKRFRKYIDFNSTKLLNHHYEKMCNGRFKELSYKYMDEISDFSFTGFSHIDKYEKGRFFWFIDRCFIKMIALLFSTRERPGWIRPSLISMDTEQYAGTYDRSKFIKATQSYLGEIFKECGIYDFENTVIDQLVPVTNVERYLDYLPQDIEKKVFIVDRDPRDLFVSLKYFTKEKGIPCKDVKMFCDWFLWTRGQAEKFKYDSNIVKKIRFEDMIYDYENTRNEILKFVGIDNNVVCNQCSRFDPHKSINNTQVWLRYPQALEEIEYIEKKLSAYVYDFSKYDIGPNVEHNNMFDC